MLQTLALFETGGEEEDEEEGEEAPDDSPGTKKGDLILI